MSAAERTPATRNRARDHLISANVYSQMLCLLSYSRLAEAQPDSPQTCHVHLNFVGRARDSQDLQAHDCSLDACSTDITAVMLTAERTPATRNRARDHLISANVYSQMLCQLSYSRLVVAQPEVPQTCHVHLLFLLAEQQTLMTSKPMTVLWMHAPRTSPQSCPQLRELRPPGIEPGTI